MGPVTVSLLGLVVGVVCHRRLQNFWLATGVATFAASIIWIVGVYVFLALMAPSELGPPLPGPILLITGNALISAVLAGGIRAIAPANPPMQRTGGNGIL